MSQIKNPPRKDDPLAGDLSEFLAANRHKMRRLKLTFAPKNTMISLRLPQDLIDDAKALAKRKHVKYQALMREAIADFIVREGE
jgi:predicted DNA binding CopG/RHH family protein